MKQLGQNEILVTVDDDDDDDDDDDMKQRTISLSSLTSLFGVDADDDEYAGTSPVLSGRTKCLYRAPFCDFIVLSSTFLRLRLAAPESHFEPLIPDISVPTANISETSRKTLGTLKIAGQNPKVVAKFAANCRRHNVCLSGSD